MRAVVYFAALLCLNAASALVTRAGPIAQSRRAPSKGRIGMEYVPDGISKEQWKKMKEKDQKKKIGKFDGTSGMQFKSRSFEDFQKGRESGKLKYNMPMEFAQKRLKDGSIKLKDIPYMQRPGGRPDDSDLKPEGGFKFPWQKK